MRLSLLFALLVGLVGAAIVHISVIFLMPRVAANDAWGRLSRLGETFEVVRFDPLRDRAAGPSAQAEGSQRHDFAFVDAAFVAAGCRFSLEDGPVHLLAGEETDFWTASIYSRRGDNLYSINERSAIEGRFDLLVGTSEQITAARADPASGIESAIPVEIGVRQGYLTLRALADRESARPEVDRFIRSLACLPSEPPAAEAPSGPASEETS